MIEIQKELKDISLPISEPEYRAMPELSYSTLSTYESLGFNGLDKLFEVKESPSLTFGSACDAILTGGEDEFNRLFFVADIELTDSGYTIVKEIINRNLPYDSFSDIPPQTVSEIAQSVGFWQDKKWDNRRYNEVLKTGTVDMYYYALRHCEGKTVISNQTYLDVLACVRALRESPATSGYFADDDEMSPVRRYYQLKFKAVLDGVGYRNMADLIVVDYEQKKVFPIDLKTSMGCTEWDFEDNFLRWHYYIQARLYWRIIRANMDKDPYFRDFSLEDYRFIIINPKSLTPLVWEFPLTKVYGTLIDDKGNEIRDPFEIGKELRGYLDCRPPVPNGINIDGVNIIKCLKEKENDD